MSKQGVLIIFTGGTIGSAPRDRDDPESPQVVVGFDELVEATPELERLKERGLRIDFNTDVPALDSCNIGPEHWAEMASVIETHYDEYEGFVILHGTDTMVYSASALSFMLGNLGKPVIFTGAQRSSLVDVRNDATQNIITALTLASPKYHHLAVVPEVAIYYGGLLFRGNRTIKRDTSGYAAYESPNFGPLATIGDAIAMHRSRHLPVPDAGRALNVRKRLDVNVLPIFISPGITHELIESQLATKGLRAAVVQAYGSGNVPTLDRRIIQALHDARAKRGIVVVIVSQCRVGGVSLGIYETSAALLEAGCVAAGDLNLEAAQCKLMHLFADPDVSVDAVEQEFCRSIAGEQSTSQYVTSLAVPEAGLSTTDAKRVRIKGEVLKGFGSGSVEQVLLRLRKAQVESTDAEPVTIEVYLNLDPDLEPSSSLPGFAVAQRKWPMQSEGLVIFDVTQRVQQLIRPGERCSFTLVIRGDNGSLKWMAADVAVIVREA